MTASELREAFTGATPRHVHLIGVAGSGMSGIAALLLGLGHKVSGSDKVDTVEVERLIKKGLVFHSPLIGVHSRSGYRHLFLRHQSRQPSFRRGDRSKNSDGETSRCSGSHHGLQERDHRMWDARQNDHFCHGRSCPAGWRI